MVTVEVIASISYKLNLLKNNNLIKYIYFLKIIKYVYINKLAQELRMQITRANSDRQLRLTYKLFLRFKINQTVSI